MKLFFQHLTKVVCTAAFLLFAHTGVAHSDAIISFGNTILGVNNEGHLNVRPGRDGAGLNPDSSGGTRPVGLWRNGIGDATSPGCLCEGWGVAVTRTDTPTGVRAAGFANESRGSGGLTGGTFGATSTTATSTINLSGAPVEVTHAYGPSLAADVFQGQVTIRNTSSGLDSQRLEDVVYRRVMDWDIPPTEFREFVTHSGVAANLESAGGNVRFASDNGFASSDPRRAAGAIMSGTTNVDFIDKGPRDHGSVFDFAFGSLDPGESRVFNIFYGSAATEFQAETAIALLGADVYSLGQSNTPGGPTAGTPATFLFAFGGVGGTALGSDPSVPILPFVPAPGHFEFPAPTPRRWFDPPFVDGFTYTLDGGATFTEVGAPPASFGFGTLTILDDTGATIGTLAPGATFDLSSYGLTTFSLVGIDPLLDEADPGFSTAFPTFLDWTGTATTLHMDSIIAAAPVSDPVPEPGTIILLGTGLAGIAFYSRKRRNEVK
ncbi:MAG: PEP-CTERM sorting domain-containing protein [Nitrospiria bacterium]